MGSLLERFRAWWGALDQTQRVIYGFGTALFVVFLIATGYFASRPQMVVLYSGLTSEQQAMIVEELRKQNIECRFDRPGIIEVSAKDRANASVALAMAKKEPYQLSSGSTDLTNIGSFTTPTLEREMIQGDREAKLAKAIEELEPVESATVKVNWGQSSPFARDKIPPSATVIVHEKPGRLLNAAHARAIASTLAGAVPGLTMDAIKVIGGNGSMLWDGTNAPGAPGSSLKIAAEIEESRRRTQELQTMLDQAFGAGNTIATVQVELSMDEVDRTTESEVPSEKPVEKVAVEETMNTDPGAAGTDAAAGTAANTVLAPAATDGAAGSGSSYTSKQDSEVYLRTKETEHRKVLPGAVTTMKVSVMANEKPADAKPTDPGLDTAAVTAVEGFVRGYMGLKPRETSDTKVVSVTSFPFDQTQTQEVEKAQKAEAQRQQIQQAISILPVVALLAIGFLVARAIGKMAHPKQPQLALAGGGALPAPDDLTGAAAVPMLEAVEGGLHPSAHDLPQVQASSNHDITAQDLMELYESAEPMSIEAIRERIDVPLEQIRAMALKKPEAVAALLKGWMMEERR